MTKFLDPAARRARDFNRCRDAMRLARYSFYMFAKTMVRLAAAKPRYIANETPIVCAEATEDGGYDLPIDKYMKDHPKCEPCGDSREMVVELGKRIPCPYCTLERP